MGFLKLRSLVLSVLCFMLLPIYLYSVEELGGPRLGDEGIILAVLSIAIYIAVVGILVALILIPLAIVVYIFVKLRSIIMKKNTIETIFLYSALYFLPFILISLFYHLFIHPRINFGLVVGGCFLFYFVLPLFLLDLRILNKK